MALADLIDARFQTLSRRVTVGGTALVNVISITHDKSWDQNTASCVITVASRQAFSPNNTSDVKVYEGYGGFMACTFTGLIDEWKAGSFPNTWELHCRDRLKRAEQVWLKDVAVTHNSAQAEAAVSDLLSKAGLSATAGTTSFTIGDVKPAEFKLVSIMDAVNQIAALIGWKVWQDVDGTIYFQFRKSRPSATSVWTYTNESVKEDESMAEDAPVQKTRKSHNAPARVSFENHSTGWRECSLCRGKFQVDQSGLFAVVVVADQGYVACYACLESGPIGMMRMLLERAPKTGREIFADMLAALELATDEAQWESQVEMWRNAKQRGGSRV